MPRIPSSAALRACLVIALAATLFATRPVSAQSDDHPGDKPIQVGTDFGIAPFVIRTPGGPEGFSVDMGEGGRAADRTPGVDVADMNMSGLISALMSRRIEMMVNPFGITAERSERMLPRR